jgi:hypothetical protein
LVSGFVEEFRWQTIDTIEQSCTSETVTQVQDALETPGQAAAVMPGRAVVETPAKPTTCLRCSKLWATPCTRESEYRKCKRCADKKKPCEPIPKAFWARFINLDKLCGVANLSDNTILTGAAKARLVQYVRDVEAYGRKSDSLPKSSSRRAAIVPAPRDSTVSLQLEVRGLRHEVCGLCQDLRALAGVWVSDFRGFLMVTSSGLIEGG